MGASRTGGKSRFSVEVGLLILQQVHWVSSISIQLRTAFQRVSVFCSASRNRHRLVVLAAEALFVPSVTETSP